LSRRTRLTRPTELSGRTAHLNGGQILIDGSTTKQDHIQLQFTTMAAQQQGLVRLLQHPTVVSAATIDSLVKSVVSPTLGAHLKVACAPVATTGYAAAIRSRAEAVHCVEPASADTVTPLTRKRWRRRRRRQEAAADTVTHTRTRKRWRRRRRRRMWRRLQTSVIVCACLDVDSARLTLGYFIR
jgi:hypothetical protein